MLDGPSGADRSRAVPIDSSIEPVKLHAGCAQYAFPSCVAVIHVSTWHVFGGITAASSVSSGCAAWLDDETTSDPTITTARRCRIIVVAPTATTDPARTALLRRPANAGS